MTNLQKASYIVPLIAAVLMATQLGKLGILGALMAFPTGYFVSWLWGQLVVPYLGARK